MNIFDFPGQLSQCGLQTIGHVVNRTAETVSQEWSGSEEERAIETIGYELSDESIAWLEKIVAAGKQDRRDRSSERLFSSLSAAEMMEIGEG